MSSVLVSLFDNQEILNWAVEEWHISYLVLYLGILDRETMTYMNNNHIGLVELSIILLLW